jgi:anti-sigma regulatory factor (Ser/Thr protein kinase)
MRPFNYIEMPPDTAWSEVVKGRGRIEKNNIQYFVSRTPDMLIPACLEGYSESSRHSILREPNRTEFRHLMGRWVPEVKKNEHMLTFVYETFSNAIRHGAWTTDDRILRWTMPMIVVEREPDRLIFIIQDRGIGIDEHRRAHKKTERYKYYGAHLGLEILGRVEADLVGCHSNSRGTVWRAAFSI